jgi:mono/diheme cytochrome c family protein
MGSAEHGESPVAHGRVLYETNCAPCHGPSGRGGYLGPHAGPPALAGIETARLVRHVREGGKAMPAFSSVALPDAALHDLAAYVHDTLGTPAESATHIGPRAVDPFVIGLIVWGALAVLALVLAVLFAEGRNG